MKLYRVFLIVLMTSAFAVVGCGDSGQSASDVCDACNVQAKRGDCERVYNLCIEDDAGSQEDCVAAGLASCAI